MLYKSLRDLLHSAEGMSSAQLLQAISSCFKGLLTYFHVQSALFEERDIHSSLYPYLII